MIEQPGRIHEQLLAELNFFPERHDKFDSDWKVYPGVRLEGKHLFEAYPRLRAQVRDIDKLPPLWAATYKVCQHDRNVGSEDEALAWCRDLECYGIDVVDTWFLTGWEHTEHPRSDRPTTNPKWQAWVNPEDIVESLRSRYR